MNIFILNYIQASFKEHNIEKKKLINKIKHTSFDSLTKDEIVILLNNIRNITDSIKNSSDTINDFVNSNNQLINTKLLKALILLDLIE